MKTNINRTSIIPKKESDFYAFRDKVEDSENEFDIDFGISYICCLEDSFLSPTIADEYGITVVCCI